jgi:signal transduction histidine kinase
VRVVAVGKEPDRVRSYPPRAGNPPAFRQQLERLDGLPLRPASVRSVLCALPEDDEAFLESEEIPKPPPILEIDPGWVLEECAPGKIIDPLEVIARRRWWTDLGPALGEAFGRHWRHSVAVSQAARRLARESGDAEPDLVASAGLLHGLGRWAAAAVDPTWLADWFGLAEPKRRLAFERETLGTEATSLGRVLAERWGCRPLLVDAAWLHGDRDGSLGECAADRNRLALVQEAFEWAEQTPWALARPAIRDSHAADPWLRLLIAEVQVRCAAPFVEPDATAHEERLARSNARLRRQVSRLRLEHQARERFQNALAESEPSESPQSWADRAGLWWCGEPGVTAARVIWTGTGAGPRADRAAAESCTAAAAPAPAAPEDADPERPPSALMTLEYHGQRCALIKLWTSSGPAAGTSGAERGWAFHAWQAWGRQVAERARLAERLERAIRVHRDRVAGEEPRLARAKLAALAEFAAGAGHELNNPLAVIVGRAQLLLACTTDPGAVRSLRAILTQAQRAHRILRDLMFFARPPEPRPRFCQPEEIVRNCLRDLREFADERGVRLGAEARPSEPKVWADPDALRHLTEVLLRNALEATPKGGGVQVTTTTSTTVEGAPEALSWLVQDSGRGVSSAEAAHLFDPFYCGRQAGRGLGLGLPRAARIVEQAGGEIRWHPAPGQGTIFHVHLPLAGPPVAPAALAAPPTGSVTPKDDPAPL